MHVLSKPAMHTYTPSPSLPMEVLIMIAKEADDEDVPTQRLVSPSWASATSTRFASMFTETAFQFERARMKEMLQLCRNTQLAPHIRTLTIIHDSKRKRVGKFHDFYNDALLALKAYGQSIRLGIRWTPDFTGELVTPSAAARGLVGMFTTRIIPAAVAAGLDCNDLLFELPDPLSTWPSENDYSVLVRWIAFAWIRQSASRRPFNPKITIRFGTDTPGTVRIPTFTFTRNPNKVVCHNLLARHLKPFVNLVRFTSQLEIHLVHCEIPEDFFQIDHISLHRLRLLTLENVAIFEGEFLDRVEQDHPPGCAGNLLRDLMVECPNLNRLKLENISEGGTPWLHDGPHTFDITGAFEIARGIPYLLDGYRGWEIGYMCTDDEFVKLQIYQQWQGQDMGSGLVERPALFARYT